MISNQDALDHFAPPGTLIPDGKIECDDCGTFLDPGEVCPMCAVAQQSMYTERIAALARSQLDEALDILSRDLSVEPTWWSPKVNALLGPILPGITLVGARPGGGKTTVMYNQMLHNLHHGIRTVVIGLETPPALMKINLCALMEKLPPDKVESRDWDALPVGAQERLTQRLRLLSVQHRETLVFAPEDRITPSHLGEWIDFAHQHAYPIVIIDHLHEVSWGDPDKLTASMTEGLRAMRAKVQEYAGTERPVRVLAAAQLRRPAGYDRLEEYIVPPLSAIKQSGAGEEIARVVAFTLPALKPTAPPGDLDLVRRNQLAIDEVIERGTMVLQCAKHRTKASSKLQEVRLYVRDGRILDNPADHRGWVPAGGPPEEGF